MRKFRGQIQVNFSFSENFGPKSESAGVSLKMTTHNNYEFINADNWSGYNFGYSVEKGVRDGLVEIGYDPDLGIKIVLESVDFDPVNSSERSFYIAAKSAAMSRAVISFK